jgi:prepilin-type N-terminal cleavage/methylation domain-containing protein
MIGQWPFGTSVAPLPCMRTNIRKGFTLVEIMIVVLIIGILLAIAMPNFFRAREASRTKTCITNLREIDEAKQQFAMAHNLTSLSLPARSDLTPDYVKHWPACPNGGNYLINPVDADPTCSTGGLHTLASASAEKLRP